MSKELVTIHNYVESTTTCGEITNLKFQMSKELVTIHNYVESSGC